jgi:[acyl-carrier-protein] S-malonyltransferase
MTTKVAYLFPGQGSQTPGMGRELAQDSPAAAEVLAAIDDALGFSLSEIMFGDDAAALMPTQIQQPAIFAHSMAAFAALRSRHGDGPLVLAGHSLGEYAAVCASGALELCEAACLVRTRGELMGKAAEEVGGAMAAVLGMTNEEVEALVQEASSVGVLAIANYNTPGQIVISGEAEAVAKARELARERSKKVIPLKVSGAFHSPLMAPAAEALRPHLEAADLCEAMVPVVSNVDAVSRCDAEGIKQALIAQVTQSVRWEDSVRRMIADGVEVFIELGPGTVLSKMIPRIDDSVAAYSVGTLAEVYAALELLG